MRTREEIEKDDMKVSKVNISPEGETALRASLILEVLLDIRDLLTTTHTEKDI